MSRTAKQTSEYQFTVTQQALIHNGVATGYFGNFREDTGKCLGVTSEQYGLVQNTDLLNAAESALQARGLTDFERKVTVVGDGERLYAQFMFANKQLASQVGDIFGYVLTLKNSFDRSMRAAFELGFMRLVCKNGASTLEREFGLTAKQSSKVSVEFVGKAVDNALAHGQRALKVYDVLANTPVSDEQGQNILKQLEASKVLSGSLRQSTETFWLAPRRQEDKARNLYNLYNALTEHLTHQVQDTRFEYASRIGNNVLIQLYNAARSPDKLGKLILPIPDAKDTSIIVDAEIVGDA